MRIIPALDIIGGKCVRLAKGDFNTITTYHDHPLEVAKMFEAHGMEYLHLVDLDGAKSAHIVNYKILEEIASKTKLQVDFGGGLKSDEDIRIAFESGAKQITGGSIAVKEPQRFKRWLKKYGEDKIILGADAKGDKIAISGWLEESEETLLPFILKYAEDGIQYVICTDISKDGMLEGSSIELYESILEANPAIKLIASGGVTSIEEIGKLAAIGCEGAIIGKAIYEGNIALPQLEKYIINAS